MHSQSSEVGPNYSSFGTVLPFDKSYSGLRAPNARELSNRDNAEPKRS